MNITDKSTLLTPEENDLLQSYAEIPTATVGQIVKDFEHIASINPGLLLFYCNDAFDDRYVKDVKLQENIAILETTGKKYRAATVGELLPKLQLMNESTGVVLQDGWKWRNFEQAGWKWLNIEPDGSTIFWYNEEYNFCLFRLGKVVYVTNDKTNRVSNKRVMTTKEQVLEDLGRFVEKCPERKIVCIDNDDTPVFINCVELDEDEDFRQYTLTRDEEGKLDMTVGKLIECLTENISDDTDPEENEAEVLVYLNEDECPRYLDDSSDNIFFEYTVDGETVIAFRCGDDAETDYDFLDDVD